MQFITLVHCGLLYTFVMIWIALRETLASFLRRNPELEERIVNRFVRNGLSGSLLPRRGFLFVIYPHIVLFSHQPLGLDGGLPSKPD